MQTDTMHLSRAILFLIDQNHAEETARGCLRVVHYGYDGRHLITLPDGDKYGHHTTPTYYGLHANLKAAAELRTELAKRLTDGTYPELPVAYSQNDLIGIYNQQAD